MTSTRPCTVGALNMSLALICIESFVLPSVVMQGFAVRNLRCFEVLETSLSIFVPLELFYVLKMCLIEFLLVLCVLIRLNMSRAFCGLGLNLSLLPI